MELISANCRLLSEVLFPYRKLLFVGALVGIVLLNTLSLNQSNYIFYVLYIFTIWPFTLWFVTFAWGNREKNKYKKMQLFMLPFAAVSVWGLISLVPITLWSLFKIYVFTIGS